MGSIGTEIIIKAERRPCFVGDRKAMFHRWIDKEIPILRINSFLTQKAIDRLKAKFEQGIIPDYGGDIVLQKGVLGLVEYEDGTVAEVEPTSVRFDVELEKEL